MKSTRFPIAVIPMDTILRLFGAITLAAFLSACSQTVALEPTVAVQPVAAPLLVGATVSIPEKTANHIHAVRSFLAGYAHSWEINVGEAIVNYSKAFFASAITPGQDYGIQIDLLSFDVRDFEAHCQLQFTIRRDGRDIFQKSYMGKGLGYAARVVWGGAFAMKSSMRKTTDEALRSIFDQFLQDLAARKQDGLS